MQARTERIVAAPRGGYFTASMPPKMLSHHCMICGKGLTDPASMARWIGPASEAAIIALHGAKR